MISCPISKCSTRILSNFFQVFYVKLYPKNILENKIMPPLSPKKNLHFLTLFLDLFGIRYELLKVNERRYEPKAKMPNS
jgi:hypothetical protein